MWMMFVSLRNKKTLIFTSYFSKIFFMKFATILIKCSRILWQILETVQRSQISDKRKKRSYILPISFHTLSLRSLSLTYCRFLKWLYLWDVNASICVDCLLAQHLKRIDCTIENSRGKAAKRRDSELLKRMTRFVCTSGFNSVMCLCWYKSSVLHWVNACNLWPWNEIFMTNFEIIERKLKRRQLFFHRNRNNHGLEIARRR